MAVVDVGVRIVLSDATDDDAPYSGVIVGVDEFGRLIVKADHDAPPADAEALAFKHTKIVWT